MYNLIKQAIFNIEVFWTFYYYSFTTDVQM